MTEIASADSSQYLCILRKYVLSPLLVANTYLEQEREEVKSEQEAFEQFAVEVAEISTVSPNTPVLPVRNGIEKVPSRQSDALRKAYRETVMAVPHYDEVYGESLTENIVVEFGPEFSELFQSTSGASFTDHQKKLLIAAAKQSAEDRADFTDTLDSEKESLRSSQQDLTKLLDELDTSIVPAWYRQQFTDQLEDVLSTRQTILTTWSSLPNLDGHDLCAYLYGDELWTYPVLTAIARLLHSVVIHDSD